MILWTEIPWSQCLTTLNLFQKEGIKKRKAVNLTLKMVFYMFILNSPHFIHQPVLHTPTPFYLFDQAPQCHNTCLPLYTEGSWKAPWLNPMTNVFQTSGNQKPLMRKPFSWKERLSRAAAAKRGHWARKTWTSKQKLLETGGEGAVCCPVMWTRLFEAALVNSQMDLAGYTQFFTVGPAVPPLGPKGNGHMQCSLGNMVKINLIK